MSAIDSTRQRFATGRRSTALVVLLFFATSVCSVLLVMDKYPYPSPIDEVAHFDYMLRMPSAPVIGDTMTQPALSEWACRTSGPEVVLKIPRCGKAPYSPEQFPGTGLSTAGSTPPLYYAVTALAVRPVASITGVSALNLARGFGAFWLTGLMLVCYAIARRLKVGIVPAAAAAMLVGTSTSVIASAATVGPDTATAAMSGLVILAALRYDGSRRRVLELLGAVLLASLTKFVAFEAVGVAVIMLLAMPAMPAVAGGVPARRARARAALVGAGAIGLFSVVSFLWGLRFTSTATIDPDTIYMNQVLHAESIDWSAIAESLLNAFVSPATSNWVPGFFADPTNSLMVSVLAGLSVVATLAAAATLRRRPQVGALGLGLLVMVLVSPFVLTALNFYVNHLYFGLAPRYGYGLLAGITASIAWLLRTPGHRSALVVLAALSLVNVFT
jgi:hypothetical protein